MARATRQSAIIILYKRHARKGSQGVLFWYRLGELFPYRFLFLMLFDHPTAMFYTHCRTRPHENCKICDYLCQTSHLAEPGCALLAQLFCYSSQGWLCVCL